MKLINIDFIGINNRSSDSNENGFISAFSAITIVVVILLCFIAIQFSINTIKSLRYSRIVAAISQNQKSSPNSAKAYLIGAAIARLQGLVGAEPTSGIQELTMSDGAQIFLKMKHDESTLPAGSRVSIQSTDISLANAFGFLLPQDHFVELAAKNASSTVYNEFDISESMVGPMDGHMNDIILTQFGIPLDPYRHLPKENPARDPFSPMETGPEDGVNQNLNLDQLLNGHYLRSRLPFYYVGVRAKPRDENHYKNPRSQYRGAEDLSPASSASDLYLTFCDSRGINNFRYPEQKINEPGFRTTITAPDGSTIVIGPQDQCTLPWESSASFMTNVELQVCGVLQRTDPNLPEIPGYACSTQAGALRNFYSNFWLSYKSVLEKYLLEIDKISPQVLGVFAGATPAGPANYQGNRFRSNFILWNGSETKSGIYGEPIALNNLYFEPFTLSANGPPAKSNISSPIGIERRVKMALLYPYEATPTMGREYEFIKPRPEDRASILRGARFLDPLSAPAKYQLLPFRFGGYNSYALSSAGPFTRAGKFNWPYEDSAHELSRNVSRGFIPAARGAEPPVPAGAHPSWSDDYSVPFYHDIDPDTGALTAGVYDTASEARRNFALPYFKSLIPSKGGTDILAAIKDVADLRERELQIENGEKKRAVLVLATDGAPESVCDATVLAGTTPGATCAGRTFDQDMAAIKSELARFESGGNTFVILLHMQHGGANTNQDHVRDFIALFQNTPENINPEGRFYFPLGNLTQSNIAEQLQTALQIIYQKIDSFAVFE